jgi:hypothetical protein
MDKNCRLSWISISNPPPPLHLMLLAGQPKRHLLTTGWSLFVGAKRLKAGDSVLFIRYASKQLV